MIAVCQQPNYFPWLGFLEQCARADTLILLDSVQWIKRGWQHRARLLPHEGSQDGLRYQWLTIPVANENHRKKRLNDLIIPSQNRNWPMHHWRTIQAIYGKRPYFKSQIEPFIKSWFENQYGATHLFDVLENNLELCLKIFDLTPTIVRSSTLPATGSKTERLVCLCKSAGATTYYSGVASTRYIDHGKFREANVRLVWQHWRHPTYEQGRSHFTSHLSALDVLANQPIALIKELLAHKQQASSHAYADQTL